MTKLSKAVATLGAIFCLLPGVTPGNQIPREHSVVSIRTAVDLVLVPVTVTDRRGAVIMGLTAEQFTVLDNDVAQRIASFYYEDEPCSIGIVLDVSGSMKKGLGLAETVVRQLLERADDRDESFLVTVATQARRQSGFTSDSRTLEAAVAAARAGGDTALNDGVMAGLEHLRLAHRSRRSLIVVSDGVDNHSRSVRAEVLRTAMEADVQVYTVALPSPTAFKKPMELVEQRSGAVFLQTLADRSGGVNFELNSAPEVASIADKIGRATHHQYVIGYYPGASSTPGKWRKIRVRLVMRDARVNARNGYYAR